MQKFKFNMPKNSKQITQIYWQNVRKEFAKANKKLAQIIDGIAPDKKLALIKIRYAFGDKIIEEGKFSLLDTLTNHIMQVGILTLE